MIFPSLSILSLAVDSNVTSVVAVISKPLASNTLYSIAVASVGTT
ncbi:hypothetical protein [Clostridium cochlearium]|nr:hypothetical protein [Clostridium cochlearium]